MATPTVITMHSSAPATTGGYGYARPSAQTASSVRPSSSSSMNVKIKTSKVAMAKKATSKRAKRS